MTPPPARTATDQSRRAEDFDPTRHLAFTPIRFGTHFSLPWHRRKAVVLTALIVALAVAVVAALTTGRTSISATDVLATLTGHGRETTEAILWNIRLPRVVTGVVVGAALAASGGVFQSMSGNALGSPDIIGFTSGAAAGAVVLIVIFGAGPLVVSAGAMLGGLLAALVVYALSFRGGAAGGYRVILVGIGVGALLRAVTTIVLTQYDADIALAGHAWLTGTLNARTWTQAAMAAVAVIVLLPVLLAVARHLNTAELGDDLATQLGVPVQVSRVVTVAAGVGLVGAATAAAGPISFIALAAPHLTRRMVGVAEVPVVTAAVTGSLLVVAADLLGQRLPQVLQMPIGLTSGVLGGVYLLWLLSRPSRSVTT
ncbi:FecCD family ABC transporter permease [Austwickia chelonae]|uniref:FecCD family ABC transporter permease n=1 Tax=Austwickia chelonae TaxID=100225 RepID=UPI000E25285F|nr:iron chelate uptake ABC transporter family permease subunit [Austwickia chelonae]